MKNYLELSNPPLKFLKACKRLYKQHYKKHIFDIKMSERHISTDLLESHKEILRECIPVEVWNISWNCITNAGPPAPSHIDRGRKTALQMPIVADPNVHFSYVLKDEKYFDKLKPKENPTGFIQKLETQWENQRYPNMPMFHYYEPEYFDITPVKPWVPYLNDTSVPHGGIHSQPLPRYFFSLSIAGRKEIAELKEDFKDWLIIQPKHVNISLDRNPAL